MGLKGDGVYSGKSGIGVSAEIPEDKLVRAWVSVTGLGPYLTPAHSWEWNFELSNVPTLTCEPEIRSYQ